jgi:DNA polymerase III subunit beta
MKTILLKNKIKEGINIVERISVKSFSLPVLKNILIKTEKNYINLSATDLEMGISWWNLAKIEKEGQAIIPTSIFSNIINLLPNKNVELSATKNNLNIKCDSYKTQIKCFQSDEFPIIPPVGEKLSLSIDIKTLCEGLNKVVDIPSPSNTRPEISGILFLIKKKELKLVGTDSYRLSEKIIHLPEDKGNYSFIVPQKAVREIVNIFKEKEGQMRIVFGANQVLFEVNMENRKHPEIQLVCRLIDGQYPNYEEIIPQDFQTQIQLDKNEFLNQIKAAGLFSGKVNEISIKTTDKDLEIFSSNSESGEYESKILGKIKGKKNKVSFNYRFLSEGINSIKGSEIILELNGESGPGVIRPVGEKGFVYIIMPIKPN